MSDADASNSSMVELLKKLLIEYGTELLKPCDSTEQLLKKLDKLESLLANTLQDDKKLVDLALQPSKVALVTSGLIKHAELDVRVTVASCISEIIRITAPDEPYDEDQMKEFFQLANSAFESLPCMSGRAYSKAVSILQNISFSQSCVMMLDLELYAIVHQMFHLFFDGIRTSHSHDIFSSMENIMTVIIHNNVDYDELSLALVRILLDRLIKENQNVSPVAFHLAENLFKNCSGDLKRHLPEAVRCLNIPINDYAEVVVSLFQDATPRENLNSKDTVGDLSNPGKANLATEAGLCNLREGNEIENLKDDENLNEIQQTTSHSRDEPPNLRSANQMQQEQKPDAPILKKRTRKPNSLIKAEEGYDPFWMFVDWTSFENSHCKKNKKKNINRQSGAKISKDSFSLAEHMRGHSSAPISSKAKKILKDSKRRQGHSTDIYFETKDQLIVSEDLTRDGFVQASRVRTACRSFGEEVVGYKIKVWWPLDEMFYEGEITAFDHVRKMHKVEYDDGDIEILDLTRELWRLLGDDDLYTHEQEIVAAPCASTEMLSDRGRKSSYRSKTKKTSKIRAVSRSFGEEVVGRRIKVWWRRDKMFHKGKIVAFDDVYKIHQVEYDNGVIEILDLTRERWLMISDDNLSTHDLQEIAGAPSASTEMLLNDRGRKCSHLSKRKKVSGEVLQAIAKPDGRKKVGREK